MRQPLAVILVLMLASASILAQETPWARLRELSPGVQVVITTTSGAQVDGRVEMIGEDRITIIANVGGQQQIARTDVRTVIASRRDAVWNGVLAGAALGFGGGAGFGAAWFYGSGRYGAKPPGYASEFITATGVIGSAIGALVGWRIDAVRNRRDVIYDAGAIP